MSKLVKPTLVLKREDEKIREARMAQARLIAAREFTTQVEDGRANYASMLSRVWRQASDMLTALECDPQMPVQRRITALRDLAKIMPMLAKAEAAHVARLGGIAVEDMSEAQLEAEISKLLSS